MSEAAEAIPFQQLGETFVVANPEAEFNRKLESFYSDTRRQLGGRALALTSDSRLRVFREELSEEFKRYNPDTITMKELSALQTNLRRRGLIYPVVYITVGVEPERDKNGKIAEQPGIVLRFNILVDKLTAQALRSTWLINSDQAIPMHIAIPRHHMRMGSELLEARDDLLEALKDTSPLTVEGLHLSSPNVRI
jgi:hypothetical protein